jgi:hypothetical protein
VWTKDNVDMPANMIAGDGALPLQRRERRPTSLSAYATRQDGSVVELTVVDLSADGCGVLCQSGLRAGERLNLAVLRRGTTGATVCWADGGRAGLSFDSPVAVGGATKPRCHERVSVDGEVAMRRAGKTNFRVHIYDISPDGCKAEFVDRPELGEQLWIKFDGMEALEAHVCWIAGARAGLRFGRQIHSAIFDLLVARLAGR